MFACLPLAFDLARRAGNAGARVLAAHQTPASRSSCWTSAVGRLLGEPRVIAEELRSAAGEAVASATTVVAIARGRAIAGAGISVVVIEPGRGLRPSRRTSAHPPGRASRSTPPRSIAGAAHTGGLSALPSIRLAQPDRTFGLTWQRIARGEDPPAHPVPSRAVRGDARPEWPIEVSAARVCPGRLLDPLCARLERAIAPWPRQLRLRWRLRGHGN